MHFKGHNIYDQRRRLYAKGRSLIWPFVDKIMGYKNLWELRPHHHNTEYRMIFFWQKNTAYFVHTFIEKGQKKKNQREYRTAEKKKRILETILSAQGEFK